MKLSPNFFRLFINLYPPYFGTGIKIEYISKDWKELHVLMKMHWYNRNTVGTHFGGSLYSMIDPHLMLLLMRLLGSDYIVWDKSAKIEFVKATNNKVRSIIKITDYVIEEIKLNTSDGTKYFPKFIIEILDDEKKMVASIEKVIYIRKKSRNKSN